MSPPNVVSLYIYIQFFFGMCSWFLKVIMIPFAYIIHTYCMIVENLHGI